MAGREFDDVIRVLGTMAKDYDGWNIFHCIYNTKLNHDDSVKDVYDTYIIFVVNKYKYGKIKNAYKKHAELTLIEKLSSLYPHNRPMHVDVYMNNSPCRDCALELLEFLEASRQTQITVYFANLYNIRRKSCIISMEKHVKKVEKNDDDQNSEGLRRLMDHKRCKLLPFNLPAWTELYDIFGVQDPEFELNVDYTLMKAGKDRSREKEDLLLLEDLDYIYLQEIYDAFEESFRQLKINGTHVRLVEHMSTKERREVFEHIFSTELNHEGFWKNASATYLIYITNEGKFTRIQNFYRKHAEITLIEQLTERYVKKIEIPMHVVVYINNSPCEECAYALRVFLGKFRQVDINIYFANLYKIRRISCIRKGENHVRFVKEDDSTNNSKGLRMLMDHRHCTLQPFNKQAWEYLSYQMDGLTNSEAFDQKYRICKECHDRSRAVEDAALVADLEYIEREEVCMILYICLCIHHYFELVLEVLEDGRLVSFLKENLNPEYLKYIKFYFKN